jgi:predicted RNA binding protein YcfA (HicA-like mRNA interferase family)
MPKIPPITPKKLLRVLLRAHFYIHHQRGSHVNLRHVTKTHLHVVVPNHGRDLAPKTLRSILIQAEITPEEFIILLDK